MKVIAFNGSPHANGVIAKGISVMAAELSKEDIETEVLHVGNKHIQGCMACYKCNELKRCAISGDMVHEAFEKMQAADGVILGSPVYYGSVAGTFKSFLDRLFFSKPMMAYKVGATVVSLRRTGGIATFQQLHNYFNLTQMVITPSIYWNVIHGNSAEEVTQDHEGLQIIEAQGRNMAWLIKTLAAGRKEVPVPAPISDRKRTNFIR
jgi:multimeric flavodoxin WrbA